MLGSSVGRAGFQVENGSTRLLEPFRSRTGNDEAGGGVPALHLVFGWGFLHLGLLPFSFLRVGFVVACCFDRQGMRSGTTPETRELCPIWFPWVPQFSHSLLSSSKKSPQEPDAGIDLLSKELSGCHVAAGQNQTWSCGMGILSL